MREREIVKTLRVLNLGAGVQSSTIAMMMQRGQIEKADVMIFADTGAEPLAVYHWLGTLVSKCTIPFVKVQHKEGLTVDIERAAKGVQNRCGQPPMFTANGGRTFRKCTRDFKIDPIRRKIQELRGGKNGLKVVQVFGISFEERHRMRVPDAKWIVACEHPLIDMQMTRYDCKRWMVNHGYPIPPRSACTYCPHRCNTEWQKMRDLAPIDWAEACRMDELMRDGLPGLREKAYIHRSLVPLAEADLRSDVDRGQLVLGEDGWSDCEGMCGV